MKTVVRNAIFTGAAFAAAASGCASNPETAEKSPLVVADNGTMTTVTNQETTSLPPKEVPTIVTTTRPDQPDTLITEDGIGDLYIGQKKSDVEEAGYYLSPGCGGDNYRADNPQTSVSVDFVGGLVEQIWISEFGPETAEGIGIGTIEEDAIQILGKAGLSPTTSIFEGVHGDVDFITVDQPGTTHHYRIDGMDGAMRVSSVVITRQGAEPEFTCE